MTAIALDGSVYIELYEPPDVRAASKKRQSAWAMQSYWGVAYESYATALGPNSGVERQEGWPKGWSGDVNTNVQVGLARYGWGACSWLQWCKLVYAILSQWRTVQEWKARVRRLI
jgi:hypothetical protein